MLFLYSFLYASNDVIFFSIIADSNFSKDNETIYTKKEHHLIRICNLAT
jgi:hypothetical protein